MKKFELMTERLWKKGEKPLLMCKRNNIKNIQTIYNKKTAVWESKILIRNNL